MSNYRENSEFLISETDTTIYCIVVPSEDSLGSNFEVFESKKQNNVKPKSTLL